ncbi:MAG: hypothetical protein H0W89_06780 [Candidatus Levybacteria bacterium]|nr:hypothetical protein [Candidatus Levybacteria bacterium]
MNIGIDFDGVINTNNATTMAILENAIAHKLGYRVCEPKAINSKDRYGFTDADYEIYQTLRHNQINSQQYFADMRMMSGADSAIKTLNEMGHQTYLVTSRGCDSNGELDANVRHYVHQTLKKWEILDHGLIIDENYSFSDPTKKQIDKVVQCKNLDITVLVDDHGKYIHKVRQAGFSAIHFGVEVRNWQVVITQIRLISISP